MSLGDARDLSEMQRPQLRYARDARDVRDVVSPQDGRSRDLPLAEESLAKALQLARRVEELLEDTRSRVGSVTAHDEGSAHSTRMARAMAASLVDELEVLVRPARTSGVA